MILDYTRNIKNKVKHWYYKKSGITLQLQENHVANAGLQVRKKPTFFEAENVNTRAALGYLNILTYSYSQSHKTSLNIQIHPEGQVEHCKIQRNENVTCRNLANIPNTQPFSLSSKGKNKWEVRAAS